MGLSAKSFTEGPQNMYRAQPWYGAYMAALFEADRSRIEERIRNAEQLIVHRERELFQAFSNPDERRALNNALHALEALWGCLKG